MAEIFCTNEVCLVQLLIMPICQVFPSKLIVLVSTQLTVVTKRCFITENVR